MVDETDDLETVARELDRALMALAVSAEMHVGIFDALPPGATKAAMFDRTLGELRARVELFKQAQARVTQHIASRAASYERGARDGIAAVEAAEVARLAAEGVSS